MAPRTCLALLPSLILFASPAAWAQEVPGEGDLVISEIVIAPTSGSREWFEVQNVTDQDLELEGCLLAEGHFNDEKSWTGHDDTVDESVIVPAGERAVLMYGTSTDNDPLCVAYEDEALSTCLLESTWRYGSLGFNNSDAETLSITCDGVLVDEIGFDWGEFSGDCPDTAGANCSVNLDPGLIDAASDDFNRLLDGSRPAVANGLFAHLQDNSAVVIQIDNHCIIKIFQQLPGLFGLAQVLDCHFRAKAIKAQCTIADTRLAKRAAHGIDQCLQSFLEDTINLDLQQQV